MKPRLPLPLLLALAAALAGAQTPPPTPGGTDAKDPAPKDASPKDASPKDPSNGAFARADLTLRRFNEIDVLGKLVPVILTKPQIRALLPALEKARALELDVRLKDAAEIEKLDAEATKAVEAGVNGGVYPSKELQNKIIKITGALAIRRQLALGEMVDLVYDACVKNLDAGQLKVMANTLKPEAYDPRFKSATMSEADKGKFFVRIVLLDGITYDLLLRMSKDK